MSRILNPRRLSSVNDILDVTEEEDKKNKTSGSDHKYWKQHYVMKKTTYQQVAICLYHETYIFTDIQVITKPADR